MFSFNVTTVAEAHKGGVGTPLMGFYNYFLFKYIFLKLNIFKIDMSAFDSIRVYITPLFIRLPWAT